MLEYFEDQIKTTAPITIDEAARMIQYYVEKGEDEATATEYYNGKIGKHLLVYKKPIGDMFEYHKLYEDEVETALKDLHFVEFDGSIPIFAA